MWLVLMEVVMNSSKYGSCPLEIIKNNECEERDGQTLKEWMHVQFHIILSLVGRDITDNQSIDSFYYFSYTFQDSVLRNLLITTTSKKPC